MTKKEFNSKAGNLAGGKIAAPDEYRRQSKEGVFVITSAQNNTLVHRGFLRALKAYCKHKDAQLIVGTFTYNKNGFQSGVKDDSDLWYDPEIVPYIVNESVDIPGGLVYGGELNILPTAVDPLSGLETYFRGDSGIVPHAKVAMRSLPGMPKDGARFLYTTGAVTQRNYIQKKAGQKAEFHHVFGALVVEHDSDGQWHVRQLIADSSGDFYDLDSLYSHTGEITPTGQVEAINWGDIHIEKMDQEVYDVCFKTVKGKKSILDFLQPKYQFIHDVSDFSARNHHNIKDPHFLAETLKDGLTVEGGIQLVAEFLADTWRPYSETVVVESNHDLAFQRWLKEADVRKDPANAAYFHYWNWAFYLAIERGDTLNVFAEAVKESLQGLDPDLWGPPIPITFLTENDSFVICPDRGGGIESGCHGHRGPNGSRGSPKNLRNIGRKSNTGHTHSASIYDGVYTAGVTASLDMGYNRGPSSWSHSHIVTYPNSKRTIITIHKNKKWRSDK